MAVSQEQPEQLERMWFSAREVAHALGISVAAVYRRVHDGHLNAVRSGHSVRIPRWALEEYAKTGDDGARPFRFQLREDAEVDEG